MTKQEEIEKLAEKRSDLIKLLKENENYSQDLAANSYAQAEHYIYELLQNADDAEAKEVTFTLSNDKLEVQYEGKELFDYEDVEAITTFGNSPKKDNPKTIGKFGTGFKSVFNITDAPEIHSGGYHFKIIDYIVPYWLNNSQYNNDQKTIICLPFKDKNAGTNREEISDQLANLTKECLLFLHHIETIKWGNSNFSIRKNNNNIATLTSTEKSEQYLQFNKEINIGGEELVISIAFLLEDEQITETNNAQLFAFFPIKKETIGLNFLIHAPFKTTASRETISFADEENQQINEEIHKKVAQFVAESLMTIKAKKLLTVEVLELLPIVPIDDPKDKYSLYQAIFTAVREKLSTEKLLPTHTGGWTTAEQALLARESKLTQILEEPKDCLTLFGKKYWLSTEITSGGKTAKLYNYLKIESGLGIKEINIGHFCQQIDKQFMQKKSDNWLINFYQNIESNRDLYQESIYLPGVLRKKPIIRLNNGDMVCPDDENVYLSTNRNTRLKTVKKNIAQEAEDFLETLGFRKADAIDEIRESIVSKYQKENPDIESYLEDFKIVLEIHQSLNTDDEKEAIKKKVIKLLKDCYFIACQNPQQQKSYQKPHDVYFKNDITKMWFAKNPDETVYFLDKSIATIKDSANFLTKLGVNKTIRLLGLNFEDKNIHYKNKLQFEETCNEYDICDEDIDKEYGYLEIKGNIDFDIDGLDFSIKDMNLQRSLCLWGILLSEYKLLNVEIKYKARQGNDYKKLATQQSKVKKILSRQDYYWLYDKYNKLIKKPLSDILLNDLHNDYNKDHGNINKLIEVLGLKLDKVRAFEEKTGYIVITDKKEQEEFRKYQQEKKREQQQTNETTWQAKVASKDATPSNKNANLRGNISLDLSYDKQVSTNKNNLQPPKIQASKRGTSNRNLRENGELKERDIAKPHLEKKFPDKEVIWLNEGSKKWKGYDFVVRENGKDLFYYEVKSTEGKLPQYFKVTGTQWRWAWDLYDKGEGDKYIILTISKVGGKDSVSGEFPNPAKLWQEGKLYIDFVEIRLP